MEDLPADVLAARQVRASRATLLVAVAASLIVGALGWLLALISPAQLHATWLPLWALMTCFALAGAGIWLLIQPDLARHVTILDVIWRGGVIGAIVITAAVMVAQLVNLAELGAGLLLVAHPVVAARALESWCESLTRR